MTYFLQHWHEAAKTSLGFFWMALWAFCFGYVISSLIQVLVTRHRMQETMGDSGVRSIAMGTFFGFISSSCSFAALATTRALFQKGAGLAASLAFLLSSTNLVIELGIVITLFLGWQFVMGEYVGGILLILFAWLFVSVTKPTRIIAEARKKLDEMEDHEQQKTVRWRDKITSLAGWRQISSTYVMEWNMVWKDVLIGFTVAGIISAFLPREFYTALFLGSGSEQAANPGFFAILQQTLIGPIVAFFTFIGSMGNIPLAAVLYSNGVSFAGVMAFIFSDLVVLPVLRINAQYYGWKMALFILLTLLLGLVGASLIMHYGLAAVNLLPPAANGGNNLHQELFTIDTGFFLNLIFLGVSALLFSLHNSSKEEDGKGHHRHNHSSHQSLPEKILAVFTALAAVWLVGGMTIGLILQ